jgi:trehalose synthase
MARELRDTPHDSRDLEQIPIGPAPPALFKLVLAPDAFEALQDTIRRAQELLSGRVVWNINSTALGGGVSEMLRSLLAYSKGAGIDTRWAVVPGDSDFFTVTKRIHNHLHGFDGDGGELGDAERRIYERNLEPPAARLAALVNPGDIVLLHDPQTAGLAPSLVERGSKVIWRCHVGTDLPNELTRRAWALLSPYLARADAYVFSRRSYAWDTLDPRRVSIIAPSIDPFSPKNNLLGHAETRAILNQARVLVDPTADGVPNFVRRDGSLGRVERQARLFESAAAPADGRLIVQVSRWDRLKDPIGVLRGFSEHVFPLVDSHLFLVGPEVSAVADDPEGEAVLLESVNAWRALPPDVREHVHLACLPMEDADENAAMVNAVQRRADVVVQKSLAEGFGLTVSEAMWKARPVVASRVGGIEDQIDNGVSGVLLDDPLDLERFGAATAGLLSDPDSAQRMGLQAQDRVRRHFLTDRHLKQYVDLFASLA